MATLKLDFKTKYTLFSIQKNKTQDEGTEKLMRQR